MDTVYIFSLFILVSFHEFQKCLSLVCNYCYQADRKEDCHLNVRHCQPYHVCSIQSSIVTYEGENHKEKQFIMYRMGCEHYSLCRDRNAKGPGPYGYSVISKFCCCQHRCEEADGVGKGVADHCPMLWKNYTAISNTVSVHDERARTLWLSLFWWWLFIWV